MPILRAVIVNTEGPLIGGIMISYSCSIGQTISGPNTSTCMDNGQWEPDPMDTSCAGITTILLEYSQLLACIYMRVQYSYYNIIMQPSPFYFNYYIC